jgi:hypothetical protein
MKLSNWAKTMIVLAVLLLLMLFPPTRAILLFILPLGSGIDDLIFFVLLFVFGLVALLKLHDFKGVLTKIGSWLSK